jgi:hypothetical protein
MGVRNNRSSSSATAWLLARQPSGEVIIDTLDVTKPLVKKPQA